MKTSTVDPGSAVPVMGGVGSVSSASCSGDVITGGSGAVRSTVNATSADSSDGVPLSVWIADTVWPPLRVFRVLRAWRAHAPWIGEFARVHWPAARFIAIGHTHRPGVTRLADGRIVINTGSFTPPLGGCAIDLLPERLQVRRVELRGGEFIAADTIAEFPLPPA